MSGAVSWPRSTIELFASFLCRPTIAGYSMFALLSHHIFHKLQTVGVLVNGDVNNCDGR